MLANLAWLPPPPENYRQLVRSLKNDAQATADPGAIWTRLKHLVAYALDEIQLTQIYNVILRLPEASGIPSRLKLAIIGAGMVRFLF